MGILSWLKGEIQHQMTGESAGMRQWFSDEGYQQRAIESDRKVADHMARRAELEERGTRNRLAKSQQNEGGGGWLTRWGRNDNQAMNATEHERHWSYENDQGRETKAEITREISWARDTTENAEKRDIAWDRYERGR